VKTFKLPPAMDTYCVSSSQGTFFEKEVQRTEGVQLETEDAGLVAT
jgi:hypothetical protein